MRKNIFFFLILTSNLNIAFFNAQNLKLKITIKNKEFTAILNNSDASKELIKLLPMEVFMAEHNGNEKYYKLPNKMPGRAISPGSIQAGDLMIWSSDTLVLFYNGSRTTYSYIRLGKIDNAFGLKEAVGNENIKIKLELIK